MEVCTIKAALSHDRAGAPRVRVLALTEHPDGDRHREVWYADDRVVSVATPRGRRLLVALLEELAATLAVMAAALRQQEENPDRQGPLAHADGLTEA